MFKSLLYNEAVNVEFMWNLNPPKNLIPAGKQMHLALLLFANFAVKESARVSQLPNIR